MDSEQRYEFDVFISFSGKDEAWVRSELLPRIEQAGLTAFTYKRDFKVGAPSIDEMERGVKCRTTLAVLSPDYFQSSFCRLELNMVLTLNPDNRDGRLIPLLKEKCELPLYLTAITYIDFTDDADNNLAWRQLLTAMGKPPSPEPPKEPQRDNWFLAHPYPMPPNFTGRMAERAMLTEWLNAEPEHPLLVLRALGGFGKSALSWHWLMHDVAPARWPRVVWWSFYEGDASFERFLVKTLDYLSGEQSKARQLSPREALERCVKLLHRPGTLLVLDGFERLLRAFGGLDAAYQGDETGNTDGNERDCLSLLTELFLRDICQLPGIQTKVLLTTRLRPRILEGHGGVLLLGCHEEELTQLRPADAVAFFHAQGIAAPIPRSKRRAHPTATIRSACACSPA